MRSRFAIAAVAAAVGFTPTAVAATKPEVRAMHRCDNQHVRSCIKRAAIHRGQSYAFMVQLSYCESRLNPLAVNYSSGAMGLFQHIASTWAGTPYAAHPRTSAKWSSLAAAYMLAQGRRMEWSC